MYKAKNNKDLTDWICHVMPNDLKATVDYPKFSKNIKDGATINITLYVGAKEIRCAKCGRTLTVIESEAVEGVYCRDCFMGIMRYRIIGGRK